MLEAFVAKTLDDRRRAAVEKHLRSCEPCLAERRAIEIENFAVTIEQDDDDSVWDNSESDWSTVRPKVESERAEVTGSTSPGPEILPFQKSGGGLGDPFHVRPYADTPPLPLPPGHLDSLPEEFRNHREFKLLGPIGQGGMGEVYLARETHSQKLIVLKVLRRLYRDNVEALQRFIREIETLQKLNHINIVSARPTLFVGSEPVIAMEYVAGEDLLKRLVRDGLLPIGQACSLVMQAATALEYANSKGVIHRDVKPSNMMITPGGLLKMLDFGLTKVILRDDEPAGYEPLSFATNPAKTLGTTGYTSPEQLHDPTNVDIRADLFSLGVTFYQFLTGKLPFGGGSPVAVYSAQMAQSQAPVETLRPELPKALAAVVAKMLAFKPEDRYQTPKEVAEAVKPFLDFDKSPDLIPIGTAKINVQNGTASKSIRNHESLSWVVGALLCLMTILFYSASGSNPFWRSYWFFSSTHHQIEPHNSSKPDPAQVNNAPEPASTSTPKTSPTAENAVKPETKNEAANAPDTNKPRTDAPQTAETPKPAAHPEGFLPFFVDKDLSAWRGRTADWERFGDGLVGRSSPSLPLRTFLTDNKPLANFELTFKAKLNAGLKRSRLLLRVPQERFNMLGAGLQGFECPIGLIEHDLPGDSQAAGLQRQIKRSSLRVEFDKLKRVYQSGEFNNYRIVCDRRQVKVFVNGLLIVDEEVGSLPEIGVIAFELDRTEFNGRIEFQDVQIKTLPGPSVDPRDRPSTDGFEGPVFVPAIQGNGPARFRDWKVFDLDATRRESGVLVIESPPAGTGPGNGILTLEPYRGACKITAELAASKGAEAFVGLFIHQDGPDADGNPSEVYHGSVAKIVDDPNAQNLRIGALAKDFDAKDETNSVVTGYETNVLIEFEIDTKGFGRVAVNGKRIGEDGGVLIPLEARSGNAGILVNKGSVKVRNLVVETPSRD